MSDLSTDGWAGLESQRGMPVGGAAASRVVSGAAQSRIDKAFARCFSGDDGDIALRHLRAVTLDRALGPGVSDASMRHLDGQRCLVLHIQSLIERGRNGPK
ncbi:hypothetical protein HH303_15325 [Rhodospirillaceae bacterium KN72]|uniref:Bbp19-like phage domain-containing protein n=1 Tax=Pacificispira spongiicola TaxID=2729598 RepID=A0A7Y0E258_9PROT|nr:hypothetical protein [Pacificispira spongiicola]NMM45867.1 hypothetical protein [Pacificispira spongiicola]